MAISSERLVLLAEGGEMGERMRAFDWSRTPLGPMEAWPQSLKTAIRILLGSRYPMFVWWGRELINLYNDAYVPVLGKRHPEALGRPARQIWADIWSVVGPQAETVLNEGRATWNEERLLLMERHGFTEETYFTFSYSPMPEDGGGIGGIGDIGGIGGIGGVFCVCTEDTGRVLGERRLKTLRDLGERSLEAAKTVEKACSAAAITLAENPHDFPFALIYLLDEDGRRAWLSESVQLAAGTPASPGTVPVDGGGDVWSFRRVLETGQGQVVDGLQERFGCLPAGAWADDWTRRAIVLPLAKTGAQELPAGFLVAGLSPRLAWSDEYRGFLELAAGQIATAIANVRAYEEERRRAEALAELDRAKTAFFSNVSHELRTPLTLVLGPLEETLAEAGGLDRERLEVTHRNALRLLKLVNTLLDFSRIEAGRIQAAYEPTDLAALTADLASGFRSAVERAGLRLLVDCPPLGEPVWVDPEMWEKIVLNLLSNAFKFTFEGEIEVRLRRAGDRAALTVRDTGTGIPAEELPRVFERFHRVRDARGRTFEGSGIGLSLVQELVKLHGGSVSVESEVDRGTAFTVSLPIGKAHLPADRVGAPRAPAAAGLRSAAYVEEALSWLPRPERRSTLQGHAARILLADDNADMREYVRRLLGKHEVVAVDDGLEALRAAREQPFDLVLADVMMPQLDGFGLLAELRSDERTKTLPVILLSARAGEESRVEGMQAGADDYLVKPFGAKELVARVDAHLRLQRARREAREALRASEAKFSTAFGRSPLALTITSLDDGRLIEVNEGFVRLSGYTREEAIGRTPDEIGLWIEPVERAERFRRLREGERVPDAEARFRVKSGEELIGVIGSAVVEIDGRRCVLSSVMDVTERKRMEEALRETDRRKDEFLAMLAHELRNPLAPIRNAAQVLKLVGTENAHQKWAREVIERQTQHLTRMVDDLLDVARITQGKVKLAREPLDLATIVQRAVETSRPLIDARRHHLTVALPPGPVRVEGDLTRLVQVVGNLLNNSAKYTDEGGHIRLEAAQVEGQTAVIRVRDDGMGLSADMLPHVFDLFSQADRSLDRSQGGLGIGLTLVKRMVELHGGQVEAHSDGPGRGSEFVVRLPAAVTPPPPASRAAPS